MDLAKMCIDTGRNYESSPKIRAKAWERARVYLDDAERDLMTALNHTISSVERDYLERDIDFLHKMKRISQRPRRY